MKKKLTKRRIAVFILWMTRQTRASMANCDQEIAKKKRELKVSHCNSLKNHAFLNRTERSNRNVLFAS